MEGDRSTKADFSRPCSPQTGGMNSLQNSRECLPGSTACTAGGSRPPFPYKRSDLYLTICLNRLITLYASASLRTMGFQGIPT